MTHVTAVFSHEWNWSFSPRNVRSRRRRFLDSGETISGFTAIFCDDWKDAIDEEEDIDNHTWPSRCEREGKVDFFVEHWDSSQPRYRKRGLESPVESLLFSAESPESQLSPSANSAPESLSFTATSPESQLSLYAVSPQPQIYQFDEFESEKHLHLDTAVADQMDRDLHLASTSDEAENLSTAAMNLNVETKTSSYIFPSCEEASSKQRSRSDGCEVGLGGFEVWDEFMKCWMGIHGEQDVKEN